MLNAKIKILVPLTKEIACIWSVQLLYFLSILNLLSGIFVCFHIISKHISDIQSRNGATSRVFTFSMCIVQLNATKRNTNSACTDFVVPSAQNLLRMKYVHNVKHWRKKNLPYPCRSAACAYFVSIYC